MELEPTWLWTEENEEEDDNEVKGEGVACSVTNVPLADSKSDFKDATHDLANMAENHGVAYIFVDMAYDKLVCLAVEGAESPYSNMEEWARDLLDRIMSECAGVDVVGWADNEIS